MKHCVSCLIYYLQHAAITDYLLFILTVFFWYITIFKYLKIVCDSIKRKHKHKLLVTSCYRCVEINMSLRRWKNAKEIITNQTGTRMVKIGED